MYGSIKDNKELAIRLMNADYSHNFDYFVLDGTNEDDLGIDWEEEDEYYFDPENIEEWYLEYDEPDEDAEKLYIRIHIYYKNRTSLLYSCYDDDYEEYLAKHFINPDFDNREKKIKRIMQSILTKKSALDCFSPG